MGKKSSPSPPPPPDYAGAAAAQGTANKETAIAASQLNNPNIIGPGGQQLWQTFDKAGFDEATNAWKNAGGQGPAPDALKFYTSDNPGQRPLLTQELSPAQQALYEQTQRTQGLMGGLGEQGATALGDVIGKNFDFSGAPAAPVPGTVNQQVIDAMMGRVTTDYGKAVDQKNSDLIAAGIPVTSEAYGKEMDMLNRGRNDAAQQAVLAGYQQGNTQFANETAARKNQIAEELLARQTPLNEINALLAGSQVQNPYAMPGVAATAPAAPPPVYAAANAAGQYGTDVYNAEAQRHANLQSGLFGLGGSGLMAAGMAYSDRRLKSYIHRIGTHPLGIGLYEYDIFGYRQRGVMADEVAQVRPFAVMRHPNGYFMVDYGRLR